MVLASFFILVSDSVFFHMYTGDVAILFYLKTASFFGSIAAP